MQDFAQWLRTKRESAGYTQAALAARVFVNERSIARYEDGHAPTRNNLARIAKLFKEDPHKLARRFASTAKSRRPGGRARAGGAGGAVAIPAADGLPPDAGRVLRRLAVTSGMTPEQWVVRALLWIDTLDPQLKSFVVNSIRHGFRPAPSIAISPDTAPAHAEADAASLRIAAARSSRVPAGCAS